MKQTLLSKHRTLISILMLLATRIVIQVALYQAGFIALTADDFGRTVMAGEWANSPYGYWSGMWMPFHMYIYGSVLKLIPNLLWTPRMLSAIFGLASIVIMYCLGNELFDSKKTGLLSALWMALNPAHIWLSAVPLTEIPYTLLILSNISCLVKYLKTNQARHLLWSAVWLALANGIRYEGWMFSIPYSLFLVGLFLHHWRNQGYSRAALVRVSLAVGLPWIFPVVWVIGNYLTTRNGLAFMQNIIAYKATWYANVHSFGFYLRTFWQLDWLATILAGFALVASMFSGNRRAMFWYVLATTIPFAIFAVLHGGQSEPPGNFIRYLAPFQFVLYPACASLVFMGVNKLSAGHRQQQIVILIVIVIILAVSQTFQAFRFQNDPVYSGLAVGQKIRSLRALRPNIANHPVIVERSYWQYLAVQVGANDLERVIFDRPRDRLRQEPSLMVKDWDAFQTCLTQYQASYVVVQAVELSEILENHWGLGAEFEVNGYKFYPVPSMLQPGSNTCPQLK